MRVWDIGAKPDYTLTVAPREVDLFGRPIQGLLVNGRWPGTRSATSKAIASGFWSRTADALYYEFDLKQSGTYWYHSHFGVQEQQGLTGPLIIEDPHEPHRYDEDVVVMLNDVTDMPVENVTPSIRKGELEDSRSHPYDMPGGVRGQGAATPRPQVAGSNDAAEGPAQDVQRSSCPATCRTTSGR